MNANTRLRLCKEARALLPMWGAMAGLMGLPLLLNSPIWNKFVVFAYYFGCALLGAVVFGQEFQHRTLGLLLSQPVSRRRLWWEKMSALGAAMLGLSVWMLILLVAKAGRLPGFGPFSEDMIAPFARVFLPLLVVFCTAPTLTLLARGTIGGVALTFLCPSALIFLGALFMSWMQGDIAYSEDELSALLRCLVSVSALYAGTLFLLGCRRFQHLEDIQGHGQELSLPAALTRFFAGFTERLTLNHGGVLGQLVRKEVRLHLPAFVVAGMFVGLWLLLLAVVSARPPVSKEFLLLPAVWLGLGIPVIAGIVSTAEERSLGLLDWHLTLPVSAHRQWFIKVLVALGVNVVLGILLPGVLAQAAGGLLEGKHLELGFQNGEQHFLIANAVIFCAALYASTASANSMRALVGSIVLFLAGAMVLNFADYIAAEIPKQTKGTMLHADGTVSYIYASGLSEIVHRYGWILGWSCFAVWLHFLGLAGFRRSLESFWLPVRRMAVFFAVVCAFVFALIVW